MNQWFGCHCSRCGELCQVVLQYTFGSFTFTFRGSRTIALPLLLVVPKRTAVRFTTGLVRRALRDCIVTSYMIVVDEEHWSVNGPEANRFMWNSLGCTFFVAFVAGVIDTVCDMVVDPCDEDYAYLSLTVSLYL